MAEVKRLASCTFQSTLPREERHNYIRTNLPRRKFQSTLPREERRKSAGPALAVKSFQSTLPREERRKLTSFIKYFTFNFNPRSHERSDVYHYPVLQVMAISIHAPTRGATAILHKKFVYFYTIPTINI